MLKRGRRVLLITSYCGDDEPGCSEELPCLECLQMCNIAVLEKNVPVTILGGWDYMTDMSEETPCIKCNQTNGDHLLGCIMREDAE